MLSRGPFASEVNAPASISLRYRYALRLKSALKGLLYSLAFYAFSVWRAANNQRGLRIAGLITLSRSSTTRLFVILALLSGVVVLFFLVAIAARFRAPRFLVFEKDSLAIPLARRGKWRRIPYASIHHIQLEKRSRKLQIVTDGGNAMVDGLLLESDEQLLAVEEALRGRIRELRPASDQ
jgi:hypothetical protein